MFKHKHSKLFLDAFKFWKRISKIFVIILKQYLQALMVLRNFVKIMLLLFRRK
jgi:hypothetical protein